MDTAFARRQMVRQQVRTSDVFDPDILRVLSDLERGAFVPTRYADLAYADTRIPLPNGQRMMTPTVEGRLLQALRPEAGERVLEVGTGSGFLTACLARMADSVVSVDIFGDLLAMASRNLETAGIANVDLLSMDVTATLPDEQFDAVAVTASLPEFDMRFVDALKPGGRLFVIVGDPPVMQARLVVRQATGELSGTSLFETCIAPLVNAERDSEFEF